LNFYCFKEEVVVFIPLAFFENVQIHYVSQCTKITKINKTDVVEMLYYSLDGTEYGKQSRELLATTSFRNGLQLLLRSLFYVFLKQHAHSRTPLVPKKNFVFNSSSVKCTSFMKRYLFEALKQKL